MHCFRKILVRVDVVDGKSEAFEQASRLAREIGARLTVVDVVRELPSFVTALMTDPKALSEQRRAERLRILKQWCASQESPIRTKVLHGRAEHSLVREVLGAPHDLLVKDAHDEEGTEQIFGGVDMRLMRNCPCPVWLVRPAHGNCERVLAAIDCQPTPRGEAMNSRIIEISSSLATAYGSQLHVVSAWQGLDDFQRDLGDWAPPSNHLIEDTARETIQCLVARSECDIPGHRVHFRRGVAGHMIPQVAAEIDANLIVMGTLARSGIPGLLIGNTAERVLREVSCSVLTVKPHDFVSPIRPIEDDDVQEFSPAWSPV